jgi:uncharacterized membrane protein YkvA (DUF1232 family)
MGVDLQTFLLILLAAILVVALAVIGVAAFLWWKVYTSDEKKLARRIAKLEFRDKISLAGALFTDGRVPPLTRIVAVALILYLASPIDLIPDFIPVIGLVDDLLIVMIGAGFVLRTIPRSVIEEHVEKFEYIEGESRPAGKQLPSGSRR